MQPELIPLCEPDVGEDEISAVADAIRSGWLTAGPKVREFEAAFAAVLGDGVEAVSVSSATAGLHLALAAQGIGPGMRVAVPTYTFASTAQVVRHTGADVVFVDSRADDYEVDLDALVDAGRAADAVMPVHFAGRAYDLEALAARLPEGVKVVDDAAHAFTASGSSGPVGRQPSDATVFSFYANKTMTTGEGGMLVTRNPELAARARVMRTHGIERDAYARFRTSSPDAWRYAVVAEGYKYNFTDPQAAMGLVQLGKATRMRDARERIALRYAEELADLPLDLPLLPAPGQRHAWHIYVIGVRDEAAVDRDELARSLTREGIGISVHYTPLHMHPLWAESMNLRPEDFPNARRHAKRALTIPLSSRMTDDQVDRVVRAVRGALS